MNKLLIRFILASFSLLIWSCNQSQFKIDSVSNIIEEAEHRKDAIPKQDFEKIKSKMAELQKDLDDNREKYTDDQIKEIGKLQGRYSAILVKKGLNDIQESIKDFGNQMDGFIEGISDTTKKQNQ